MPIAAEPIIVLDQAKSFLNISDVTYDEELTTFVNVASQMIVNRIGQVVQPAAALDEWYDGGSERIVLRNNGPIVSVTSVAEVMGTVTYSLAEVTLDSAPSGNPYTFTVDLDMAVLVRRAAGIAVPFADGIRNIHVAYVAGYGTVPADIAQACQLLVKHLWETQRGSIKPGAGGSSQPATSYSLPARVAEILAPYYLPGIA